MTSKMTTRGAVYSGVVALLSSAILITGTQAAAAGAAGPEPTGVPAPTIDAPTIDTTIDTVADTVADADVPRWPLTRDGDVVAVTVGEPLVLTITVGDDVVGFDGTLRFDTAALEYGGVAATTPGIEVLENGEALAGVGLAAFETAEATGHAAAVEVRMIPSVAGTIVVAFEAFDVVMRDGTSAESDVRLSTTLVADGGGATFDAPAAAEPVDAEPATTLEIDDIAIVADVTGDGVVNSLDTTEVQLAWDELVAAGDTCGSTDERMTQMDVNADGCVGVEDFAAVSAQSSTIVAAASAATSNAFVVTVLTDEGDNQLNDNLCQTPSGGCSLRAAIQQSNATAGANRIEFAIPGTGPHTIVINDKLPTISDSTGGLVIDGFTQPGASANTDPVVSNAVHRIAITPVNYVPERPAFAITSANNEIRGLSIYNSWYPVRMVGALAAGNRIVGNLIGTNPDASFSKGPQFSNAAGVQLDDGAHDNFVGAPAVADRNIISGNRSWGVRAEQNGTDRNRIQNNIFGLNPSGTDRVASHGGIDIQYGPQHNIIGGAGLRERNVFAGHVYVGIDFSHNSFNNQAIGNYFGTDTTGRQAFSWTSNGWGIVIKDDARLNRYVDNVVANSGSDGIYNKHNYTGGNTFIRNLIGVGVDGTALPNGRHGVYLRGHDDVFDSNVIAHNAGDGIWLVSTNDSGANANELTERNRLTRNSFYGNGGMGIDITPNGPNPNDPGDADGGTQQGLNYPEIMATSAGTTSGMACAGCRVEVYIADSSTSEAQGRQYLGFVVAAVDGTFTFNDARILANGALTTLAIDTVGNTSEFSPESTGGVTFVSWTEFSGIFAQVTVGGRQVAMVPESGLGVNNGGADATGSIVWFDVNAPMDGQYVIDAEVYAPGGGADSFWVVIDDDPGDGALWDIANGNTIGIDAVNDRDVADPVVYDLSAGAHRIGLAFREDGTGVATVGLRSIGAGIGAPDLVNPGPQSLTKGSPFSLTLGATPAGANFTAFSLPDGLAVNQATGVISGMPTRVATFASVLSASNAGGSDFENVVFTVVAAPVAPTITPIADQSGSVNDVVSLAVQASDANGDPITYGATGLPPGLSISSTSGLISGTLTAGGVFNVTVTASDAGSTTSEPFTWVVDAGFSCSVTGSTLSWTDEGASTYFVRHQISGTDVYVASVSGALSFQVPSQYGTYVVIHYNGGRSTTSCAAPGGPTAPVFTCSVTGSTLSWTDEGAPTYYIRRVTATGSVYVGSSAGLTFEVPDPNGTYQVIHYLSGKTTTECSGAAV